MFGKGYRHLPLYDTQGEQFLFSTLFVKIRVNPFIPLTSSDTSDLEEAVKQAASSTMDSLKSTAKSVLSRGKSIRGKAKLKTSAQVEERSSREDVTGGSGSGGSGSTTPVSSVAGTGMSGATSVARSGSTVKESVRGYVEGVKR